MLLKSRKRLVAFIAAALILIIGAMLAIIYFTTYVSAKNENKDMLTVFAESYDENGFPSADSEGMRGTDGNLPENFGGDSENEGEAASQVDGQSGTEGMGNPPGEMGTEGLGNPPGEMGTEGLSNQPVEPGTESSAAPGLADDTHRYEVSTFYAVAFNQDGSVKDYMNDSASGLSDDQLVDTAKKLLPKGAGFGYGKEIVYLITEGDDYTLVTMMDTSVIDDTIDTLMRYMIIVGGIAVILLVAFSTLLSKWIMKPAVDAYEKQKRFISDAGHELKTPIATISANTEILSQETGQNKWLENIIYENNRMSVIVKDLLDLAKLESLKPVMEEVDFSSLCMAAVMPFEATAFEQGIHLDYDIGDGISVTGNFADLEKLVGILTDNAISHCKAEGKVEVRLREETIKGKTKASFMVSNSGQPLTKEEIANLFERFYRKEEARTDSQGHYGLGLSIAKAIVTAHGGSIEVKCHDGLIEFIVIL